MVFSCFSLFLLVEMHFFPLIFTLFLTSISADTVLKSSDRAPVNVADRKATIILFDGQLKSQDEKEPALSDVSQKSAPPNGAQRDVLLRDVLRRGANIAQRRQTIILFDEKEPQPAATAQNDVLLKSGPSAGLPLTLETLLRSHPKLNPANVGAENERKVKRDIASTVVGAAVSSVVANLMKNAQKHQEVAAQKQADFPDGAILAAGEMAPIANDVVPKPVAPVANEIVPLPFAPVKPPVANDVVSKPVALVANEIVPLPFAPVKPPVANEIVPLPFAPVANDVVPLPVAPINADVEVIVGNTNATTTTTSAPSEDRGFWATFFNSIKLFFGTVTNSIGGFFIDIGQRVTNFVEKRVKV